MKTTEVDLGGREIDSLFRKQPTLNYPYLCDIRGTIYPNHVPIIPPPHTHKKRRQSYLERNALDFPLKWNIKALSGTHCN